MKLLLNLLKRTSPFSLAGTNFQRMVTLDKELSLLSSEEEVPKLLQHQVNQLAEDLSINKEPETTHGFLPILHGNLVRIGREKLPIAINPPVRSFFISSPSEPSKKHPLFDFPCSLDELDIFFRHGFMPNINYAFLPDQIAHDLQLYAFQQPVESNLSVTSDDSTEINVHLNQACFPDFYNIREYRFGNDLVGDTFILRNVPIWSAVAFTHGNSLLPLLHSEHICPNTIENSKTPSLQNAYNELRYLLYKMTYHAKPSEIKKNPTIYESVAHQFDHHLNQFLSLYLAYQLNTLRKHSEEQLEAIKKRISELESISGPSPYGSSKKSSGVRHYSTTTAFFKHHHEQQLKERQQAKEMRYSQREQRAAQRRHF